MTHSHSKESVFSRIVDSFRPPHMVKTIIIIISFFAALAFLASASYFSVYFYGVSFQKRAAKASQKIWNDSQFDTNRKYQLLKEQNEDFAGWICIENTEIDNPFYQSKDQDFYKTHNNLRKKSRYGALHIGTQDDVSNSSSDKYTVIYGNNTDSKTMFGLLENYKNLNYYRSHPAISLNIGGEDHLYLIFSVAVMDGKDTVSMSDVTANEIGDGSNFDNWLIRAESRSFISLPLDVTSYDKILTLITDSGDYNGAKLVVSAKEITQSQLEEIDFSLAKITLKPKK